MEKLSSEIRRIRNLMLYPIELPGRRKQYEPSKRNPQRLPGNNKSNH